MTETKETKETNLMTKLGSIQQTLNAPKNQFNKFGNYSYRSCEDILKALKPLLAKARLVLTMSDKMEQVGERYYLVATVTLYDVESGENYSAWASAREADEQKGMSPAQITGSASSYARKYALCGMFAIDDGVDDDLTNTHNKTTANKTQNNARKTTQTANNTAKAQKTQTGIACSECGASVTEKVANYSQQKFGTVLCMECQKKH